MDIPSLMEELSLFDLWIRLKEIDKRRMKELKKPMKIKIQIFF